MIRSMDVGALDEAVELLEKANADLEPELLAAPAARRLLATYARAEKLAAFGVAALARKLDDASAIAKETGTSVGKAKETVATGKVLAASGELDTALRCGEISLDQATEIAAAERSAPGAATDLLPVAQDEAFHVLKDKARAAKLDAEQHKNLAERQRAARSARSYSDGLGMVHIHLSFEPHVGAPIVNRAEAEAARLHRAAKKANREEPFERHLCDAYATLLSAKGHGRTRRPELVVLVSHGVAKRGWQNVDKGELCKIPGVGPVSPEAARQIAQDAFLTGLFYDGEDLRHMRRWTRNTPARSSLRWSSMNLRPSTASDASTAATGSEPRTITWSRIPPRGPASTDNLNPRCWPCHQAKTARDRKAARLRPPDP
ncbi:MAG TPA: hypothetical protein VG929_04385 [Actinomycetota bacterium]|nr:hypothetical protein [Actinomycetota bacterium]